MVAVANEVSKANFPAENEYIVCYGVYSMQRFVTVVSFRAHGNKNDNKWNTMNRGNGSGTSDSVAAIAVELQMDDAGSDNGNMHIDTNTVQIWYTFNANANIN